MPYTEVELSERVCELNSIAINPPGERQGFGHITKVQLDRCASTGFGAPYPLIPWRYFALSTVRAKLGVNLKETLGKESIPRGLAPRFRSPVM
jgi:hypothetical protein